MVVTRSENQGKRGWDVAVKESGMGEGGSELHFGDWGGFWLAVEEEKRVLDGNFDSAWGIDGLISDVSKGWKCISLPSSWLKCLEI